MPHTTHLRPARTSRLFLVLFLLLPFTFLLAPTLIAQGDGGEPPFTPLEPLSLPLLSLAAAPVTINEFPAPPTPLTVTITNYGTGAAHNVTLQLDGGLLTLPISQTIGVLDVGQTLTTTLSLEFLGYEVGEQVVLLTSNATDLFNSVQAAAIVTMLEPVNNAMGWGQPQQNEAEINEARTDDEADTPTLHLLQVQRPHEGYRGRILTFALTNSKEYDKEINLGLSAWLPGVALNPSTLQLFYRSTEQVDDKTGEPKHLEFQYDSAGMTLSFNTQGDGQYILSTTDESMGENMGSVVPNDPKGWVPTFNAPTVGLFQGSVSYQYPLLTPPGPGVFQPSLVFTYNGAAGNGLVGRPQSDAVGFGWNLSGSIEVAQAVKICSWGARQVCPINVGYQGSNPGQIELTLSLGGTGYELSHISGSGNNGYPGRYTLKGNTSLYVEYCHPSQMPASALCLSADIDDGNVNGAATGTVTGGYWVVKDSQNTLYRLGYMPHSEQELSNCSFLT